MSLFQLVEQVCCRFAVCSVPKSAESWIPPLTWLLSVQLEKLTINFLTHNLSKDGYNRVLVMVNHFTNFPMVVPSHNQTKTSAQMVCAFFFAVHRRYIQTQDPFLKEIAHYPVPPTRQWGMWEAQSHNCRFTLWEIKEKDKSLNWTGVEIQPYVTFFDRLLTLLYYAWPYSQETHRPMGQSAYRRTLTQSYFLDSWIEPMPAQQFVKDRSWESWKY